MAILNFLRNSLAGLRGSNVLLVILALIFGYFAFHWLIAQPDVGVIRISGSIMGDKDLKKAVDMIRYAKESKEIKAVVLEINSPGGSASASEEIYMQVLQLRKEKPVVASIDVVGASGAYYVSIAANYIYAKPTSMVGSVGVRSVLPKREKVGESIITSGPFKDMGSSRKQFANELEMVKESFIGEVMAQRGERLKMGKEELAKARVYLGMEAVKLGLIDEIGPSSDAVKKAAELAGIANYGIIDINEELDATTPSPELLVNTSSLPSTNTVPAYYYLYREVE